MRIIIILSFTCVIDLVSSLEHDCFLSGMMEFYQKMVRRAIMICYWDGIVHFIIMSYHTLSLFWVGSLLANMSVFVTGIVVGKFGSDIRPAFWLNMPYLLLPIWGAIKLFNSLIAWAHYDQSFSLIWRPTDLFLVLLILGTMSFTFFRGLVRFLTESIGYLKTLLWLQSRNNGQILHFLFYILPMLGAFVYGLIVPGCTWMPDWTVFEWAHIGASLHPRTVVPFQIPGKAFLAVLAAYLLYGVYLNSERQNNNEEIQTNACQKCYKLICILMREKSICPSLNQKDFWLPGVFYTGNELGLGAHS
uniref:Transmembrane 6 superfamily member 2b n=1 Tax=Salmo trutta TaxID=8032 RepID=A0A673XUQ6_SALTR